MKQQHQQLTRVPLRSLRITPPDEPDRRATGAPWDFGHGPEPLFTFSVARVYFPGRGANGRRDLSTIYRYYSRGVRLSGGLVIKLEAVRIGGSMYTSRAAIERFIARQNPKAAQARVTRAEHARHERQLSAHGI